MANFNMLWLQSSGCGGCTMSLLCAESPPLFEQLSWQGINLLWHPALSEASGQEVQSLLSDLEQGRESLDLLCIEGAVAQGPDGTGDFSRLPGTGRSMMSWLQGLSTRANYVVAVGSCAAYGGVSAGGDNPSDATGAQYAGERLGGLLGEAFRSRGGLPVINISGCPIHPQWVLESLASLVRGEMTLQDLDELGRPRSYTDHLVHHGCPRNEYYEYKASAQQHSQQGCLMEHLGCIGTQAHADCNIRLWNGGGSCLRGGYACINCTAPEFENPGYGFLSTPKVAGIPIGLPTDMPKAWFVALSSLSKAAMPARLRENALSDHQLMAPKIYYKNKRR
ncbi:HupU protein [Aestuariirhabdus sp. Z084]|uniref:NADH-quinone oxidoreductase subunit B family protein n=1 Tax=Aestuariirhabdus haliotis TaxID=2918751 RepID=UPI00201B432B|nr:HupU protein [Aestuariirhabdus haliotis]MCL6415142.1 HupU protein [Aestuariirhabdus haliotis]MCL6420017.1 HupU protein [Aestuariirhabdus haliotis]